MAAKKAPGAYRRLKAQYADYMNAVEALGIAVRSAGPLPDKVTQLVQLGAAAAIRSEGAIHSHVRRALALGVSAEEIRHALISVTSTIGFPNVSAALSWAEDVIGAPPASEPARKRPAGAAPLRAKSRTHR